MDFGAVAADVHPPRARRWQKPLRRIINIPIFGARRGLEGVRGTWAAEYERRAAVPEVWTPGFCVRLLVPGWVQLAMRRRLRGYIFLGGSLLAAIVGILVCGSLPGMLALGMLFSLHAASIADAFTTEERTVGAGIAQGLLIYMTLGLLVYLPAGLLISRVIQPYAIHQDFRPFAEGDALVVFSLATIHPGDMVIYERPRTDFELGPHNWFYIYGRGIDRVLAVGGEHVKCDASGLLVNGANRTCGPLNAMKLPEFELDVPAGHYLIWPSGARNLPMISPLWQHAVLVPAGNVEGRVFFQTAPLARWGRVR